MSFKTFRSSSESNFWSSTFAGITSSVAPIINVIFRFCIWALPLCEKITWSSVDGTRLYDAVSNPLWKTLINSSRSNGSSPRARTYSSINWQKTFQTCSGRVGSTAFPCSVASVAWCFSLKICWAPCCHCRNVSATSAFSRVWYNTTAKSRPVLTLFNACW